MKGLDMPSYPYRDRALDTRELERLRLTLSSFRDGSGQNVVKSTGKTMPGFRDYERSLAAVIGGSTTENKGILDVVVNTTAKPFGISCKMTAFPPAKNESSFMELSNSAAKFRKHLLSLQINWITEPMLAGPALVGLVSSWHEEVAAEIELDASRYSVFAHDRKWERFQILCFPLDLEIASPKGDIDWMIEGQSLSGYIDADHGRHRLWQCYLNSGGQLKYYPPLSWANWVTTEFTLESPPAVSPTHRARQYFANLWPE